MRVPDSLPATGKLPNPTPSTHKRGEVSPNSTRHGSGVCAEGGSGACTQCAGQHACGVVAACMRCCMHALCVQGSMHAVLCACVSVCNALNSQPATLSTRNRIGVHAYRCAAP
eukprot:313468-Chlamydomonas_euryale.AAC.1